MRSLALLFTAALLAMAPARAADPVTLQEALDKIACLENSNGALEKLTSTQSAQIAALEQRLATGSAAYQQLMAQYNAAMQRLNAPAVDSPYLHRSRSSSPASPSPALILPNGDGSALLVPTDR